MNKEQNDIETGCDNCSPLNEEEIRKTVEEVVGQTGRDGEKVILILQEVQKKLNFLPSEALKHICRITDITPGQLSGVATFYSQFRHIPAGEHIIKICTGTACHVKGSTLISDSFKRTLGIDESTSTSIDKLFSVEEVACLGCCTLAPVVQIDHKTYGHVRPNQTEEIITDFLGSMDKKGVTEELPEGDQIDAEVRIGLGSCCVAGGSREVLESVMEVKKDYELNIRLKAVGCVGVCNQTPLLEIVTGDHLHSRYVNVRKEQVEEIILKHVKPRNINKRIKSGITDIANTFLSDKMLKSPVNLPGEVREKYLDGFLNYQYHIATIHSGVLSPDSFDEYSLFGGFSALEKCVRYLDPRNIIDQFLQSGLRGRGGAGFPLARKWETTMNSADSTKYVVCNGDEGDPGAFMDRMLLESFPFRIIEGMTIAGFVTGASSGIFYIRAEYPLAVSRVRHAIEVCYEKGVLGKNIYGSSFSFDISIFEGAGAFVCGEETALIASLEGRRGTPHLRPPYPAEKGYRGHPTLVNNVETLASVPWILNNGSDAFRSVGTPASKGTKVFALAGKVARGGLIEVPMGITIRDIVEKIGGGVAGNRKFKAVQIGGPSGGCIPESMADTPVDFEELNKLGAMMGSGGLVVLDDTDCMVDMAKYFLLFTHKQSCGKCTFCRVGTKVMLDIIDRLSKGTATLSDLNELEELCNSVRDGSLCGLGKTAPNPVLTGIRYFREEYEAHTRGICPTGKCRDLIKYVITDRCNGCTICSLQCPVDAIPYTPYEKHVIDHSLCTKCDNCRIVCPVSAIETPNVNA
ncbi:MAG: NAD(P)H-dependent oxidoreductase subunit E [Bacteroidales bacterium]